VPLQIEAVENKRTSLQITDQQALGIREVGKRLASSTSWWGASAPTPDDEDETETRSVIKCARSAGGGWDVTFSNVVGALAVGDLQFNIRPKIGWKHFLYLAERSSALPRLDPAGVEIDAGTSLRDLMVNWFLTRTESLIRADLLCDYSEVRDQLPVVKGRVDASRLALNFAQGRFLIDCEFEDFTVDTPHNRVLRHATQVILRDTAVRSDQRQRARAIRGRMDGVGPIRPGDLRVVVDRRSGFYADALVLGKALIRSVYRSPTAGDSAAWSFLLPGPAMVEDGLRNLLAESLGSAFVVSKKAIEIGKDLRLNADLVFSTPQGGRIAVGDVKYKILGSSWGRSDLYQAVTFAEGYGVANAAVVGFSKRGKEAPKLSIGSKQVASLNWSIPSSDDDEYCLSAEEASMELVTHVRTWLSECEAQLKAPDQGLALLSV
jgi:5-methylcytosine-specific restriction enzyme subunit McrC